MQQRLRSGFHAAYQSITAPSHRVWLGSTVALVLLLTLWTQISGWYRNLLIADKRSEIAADLAHDGNALTAAIDHRAVALQSLTAYILAHQTGADLPQETEADMTRETQFASNWLQQNLAGIDYVTLAPGGRQLYIFPLAGNEDQLKRRFAKTTHTRTSAGGRAGYRDAPRRTWRFRPNCPRPDTAHCLLRGVQRR